MHGSELSDLPTRMARLEAWRVQELLCCNRAAPPRRLARDAGQRVCDVAMAVALSVLVAPLFYSVVILLLDLVNLVTPMPNLVDGVYRVVDPILDSPTSPTLVDWLRFVFWATLPGLFWFGCVLLGLRRMLRISGLFDVRAGKRRRRSRLNRATPSICADLSLLRPLLRNERGDALGDLAHGLASDFQILV